ncbi:hypothetical protein WS69_14575 [Burkholderia sp. BDU5]|nr:hypothetical protein WS69_14575 [Burkholderia sp. BDU5]
MKVLHGSGVGRTTTGGPLRSLEGSLDAASIYSVDISRLIYIGQRMRMGRMANTESGVEELEVEAGNGD